jgi:hypothetical protein
MGPLNYYSVEVKLEVRHRMLIAASSEQAAVNVAFNEEIPVESLNDFDRDVVRIVDLKERVYVS